MIDQFILLLSYFLYDSRELEYLHYQYAEKKQLVSFELYRYCTCKQADDFAVF
jgi:hypothetical protein